MWSMSDVFPAYEALWKRVQSEGVSVEFGLLEEDESNGGFHTGGCGDPQILIFRKWFRSPPDVLTRDSNAPAGQPQPDLLIELITLAHEYGHVLSWKGATPKAEYTAYRRSLDLWESLRQSNNAHGDDELPKDDQQRILDEEALAWRLGRDVLTELGFDDFLKYDQRAIDGVQAYRTRFNIL